MEQPFTATFACGIQGDDCDITITADISVVAVFIVYEMHPFCLVVPYRKHKIEM